MRADSGDLVTVEDVLKIIEGNLEECRLDMIESNKIDDDYRKEFFVDQFMMKFAQYHFAGGKKTLAEILKGDS